MVRLMAAVEPSPPIPTVGEVSARGTVPTAAAAEAARQTLSAPAPPVVAVTIHPLLSNVGVPAKAATAAMPRPSPSGAQAEQLPPAQAEPANLAQSSPRARHASTPHAPVWASHCSPAPHATPAHGSAASPQRAPAQPAAHLRAAPRHRALVSPRDLNTVLTDRFEYSFESAQYCNSFELQLPYYL